MANSFLICPSANSFAFGQIKQMKSGKVVLPAGEIRLYDGRHHGPNHGYGAEHIWEEHQADVLSAGFTCLDDVPAFVELIVCSGTALHYDGYPSRNLRMIACRGVIGTAILEHRQTRAFDFWSIVTAYTAQNKKHGPRVGSVL